METVAAQKQLEAIHEGCSSSLLEDAGTLFVGFMKRDLKMDALERFREDHMEVIYSRSVWGASARVAVYTLLLNSLTGDEILYNPDTKEVWVNLNQDGRLVKKDIPAWSPIGVIMKWLCEVPRGGER